MAAAGANLQIFVQLNGGLDFAALAAFMHESFRNLALRTFGRDSRIFLLLEDILYWHAIHLSA
ncbi:hypothetical protein D3C75_1231420 [compost metagenome]